MSATAPPALPPLHGAERWLATIAVSLATFMNVLDSSIANVSIPAISGDLGVSPAQKQLLAVVAGGSLGSVGLVGLLLLIRRRLGNAQR